MIRRAAISLAIRAIHRPAIVGLRTEPLTHLQTQSPANISFGSSNAPIRRDIGLRASLYRSELLLAKAYSLSGLRQSIKCSVLDFARQIQHYRPALFSLTPSASEQVGMAFTVAVSTRVFSSSNNQARPDVQDDAIQSFDEALAGNVQETASATRNKYPELDWMEPEVREQIVEAIEREAGGAQRLVDEMPYVEIWNPLVG